MKRISAWPGDECHTLTTNICRLSYIIVYDERNGEEVPRIEDYLTDTDLSPSQQNLNFDQSFPSSSTTSNKE